MLEGGVAIALVAVVVFMLVALAVALVVFAGVMGAMDSWGMPPREKPRRDKDRHENWR